MVSHGGGGSEPARHWLQHRGNVEAKDLGRGIVRGTLGAQLACEVMLPIPANTFSFKGQVTAVEDGAYVLQECSGIERRMAQTKIL